ncbi:hypothetical protein FHR04_06865 [Deinococcus radiopugnans ATCC 19172]|uniref:Uncharacterized protein n=1 Tax=Deinococcus radiopugnans ATCC 19172 TaxID=585398 RepID=A0A5C4Y873_9DEIO|nr:hypothetical protein FHR04_06865 [Deinococcus radiopugnans ATCC 19172]
MGAPGRSRPAEGRPARPGQGWGGGRAPGRARPVGAPVREGQTGPWLTGRLAGPSAWVLIGASGSP